MKLIIAGSRTVTLSPRAVGFLAERAGVPVAEVSEVVSGGAYGMDRSGEEWAAERGLPVKLFPAEWRPGGVLDRGAGFRRNELMAEYGDALLLIWDGQSRGSAHMRRAIVRRGKPIYEAVIDKAAQGPQGGRDG